MASVDNVSIALDKALGFGDYVPHLIYVVQGILICLTNGLLLSAILRTSALRKRKELLIVAGLAGIDMIAGMGTMLYGIYRSSVLWQGQQNVLITKWECVILPGTIMSYIGGQLTSLMNVVLGTDRYRAVAWPMTYQLLDRRYTLRVMGLVFLFGAASLTAMLLTTHYETDNTPTVSKLCSTGTLFPSSYNLFHEIFVALCGITSAVIYISAFVVYRRGIKTRVTSYNDQSLEIQHRLTVTVGIITVSTLFFYIIPFSFLSACALMNIVPPYPAFVGVIFRCYPINNVIIYVYRQVEIRAEIWAILKCQKASLATDD